MRHMFKEKAGRVITTKCGTTVDGMHHVTVWHTEVTCGACRRSMHGKRLIKRQTAAS